MQIGLYRWSPWRSTVEQIPTLQSLEDPTPEQIDMPSQKLQPMDSLCLRGLLMGNCLPLKGAHIVAGFLAVFVTCGRPMVEQCIPEGLYPMEKTHAGAVLQEFSLWEGPILKKFMKSCLLWEGPHTGEREECNYEGASEASVMNPHFPSLCTFRWAEAEELNVKLSLLRGV